MYRPTLLAIALTLFCASAATAQIERPIPYPLPESPQWLAAVKAGTRTETGHPGPKYTTNYARYTIRAELFPETAVVRGHIDMTYINRSEKSMRELRVHLRQNLYKAGSLRNRFVEITGGVTVENLTLDGEELAANRYRISGTVMRVRSPRRIKPGAEVTLSMDWEYKVPVGAAAARRLGVSAVRQGHDDHNVFYLGYWYPQFAVREDVDGWVSEQYMSNSEFYMGYADYDLKLTLPEGWLVRATGSLENADQVLTDTARERLKQARSSRDVVQVIDREDLEAGRITRKSESGKHTWHFKSERVRDIAVSASNRYVWDASHAVVKNRDGEGKDGICMIHSVYKPRGRFTGRSTEVARHTIEWMSEKVYPYPWPHMTACAGVISGGMEFPMMTICGGLNDGVVTHELIHMWFPMLVGSNEKARAWQDEGFTSFYTSLCRSAFAKRANSRRLSVGLYMRNLRSPMMRHGDLYGEGRSDYQMVSYQKTSVVLKQLQNMLGDEVFFKAFQEYARDWAFKHPYPADFFRTFSRVAGQDLDWYFREWFYETWTLDQAVASVATEGDTTRVVIEDLGLATYPTVVEVTFEDGSVATKVIEVKHWLAGKKSKTLEFKKPVKRVRIDPESVTLDTSRGNNTWQRGE